MWVKNNTVQTIKERVSGVGRAEARFFTLSEHKYRPFSDLLFKTIQSCFQMANPLNDANQIIFRMSANRDFEVHAVMRTPTIVSWSLQIRGQKNVWDEGETISKYPGNRGLKHLLTGEMELKGGLEEVLSLRFYVADISFSLGILHVPNAKRDRQRDQASAS